VVERVLVRAFDKAVRRKPLAFAADAVGLWALHVGEGGLRRRGSVAGIERYGRREVCAPIACSYARTGDRTPSLFHDVALNGAATLELCATQEGASARTRAAASLILIM